MVGSAASVQGGYYTEINIDYSIEKPEPIERLVPIFEDLYIPGKEGTNPSVQVEVDRLRAQDLKVSTFNVQWRGRSVEDIQRQLERLTWHYQIEILRVRERQRRCGIESLESADWSNLEVGFHFGMPLKQKVLMCLSQNERYASTPSRSSQRSAAHTPRSTPTARTTLPRPPPIPLAGPASVSVKEKTQTTEMGSMPLSVSDAEERSLLAAEGHGSRQESSGLYVDAVMPQFEQTWTRVLATTQTPSSSVLSDNRLPCSGDGGDHRRPLPLGRPQLMVNNAAQQFESAIRSRWTETTNE